MTGVHVPIEDEIRPSRRSCHVSPGEREILLAVELSSRATDSRVRWSIAESLERADLHGPITQLYARVRQLREVPRLRPEAVEIVTGLVADEVGPKVCIGWKARQDQFRERDSMVEALINGPERIG